MTALTKPSFSPFQAACVAGGLLTVGLLAFAWNELPYVLRSNILLQASVTLALAALWFWGAYRPDVFAARWTKFWAAPRNREIVDAASRYLCVFYGPLLVGLFYTMWAVGRLSLGFWPEAIPMHDPKGFPATAVVYLLICAWLWLAPVAVLLPSTRLVMAVRRRSGAALPRTGELVATLAFACVPLWWASWDPHALVQWFLD